MALGCGACPILLERLCRHMVEDSEIRGREMLQPHFGQSGRMQLPFPKVGNLGSSETPENLEDNLTSQISSHCYVLGFIKKVLKSTCPKWPRIAHLDICNPSYGQKKGRKSNCQFDYRPLKVGNRHLPDVASRSAT